MSHVRDLSITDWDDAVLPIYFPQVVDTDNPKPEYQHLRIDRLNSDPESLSVSGSKKNVSRKWIVQIKLMVRDGIGIVKPEIVIDKILDAFVTGEVFSSRRFFAESKKATQSYSANTNGWVG